MKKILKCDNKDLNKTVNFLKVVAEENRLKILCFLKKDQKCVCEIWQHLKLPQNLISHHLKVLKNLELIDYHKDGLKVFYFLNKKVLNKYSKLINKFLS